MDVETLAQADAELLWRRRRVFLVRAFVCGIFVAVAGKVIIMDDETLLGSTLALGFGFGMFYWVAMLSLPSEVVLEMRTSDFDWLAPEPESTRGPQSESQRWVKPALFTSERCTGIWDQELDGNVLT
ncbi:hypothetical protein SAMN05444166_8403 [Singulisphaera sp. GP187]|nr:hypothetical protein SAMN05444166_8403 [Singulisphaera sp. GP187]